MFPAKRAGQAHSFVIRNMAKVVFIVRLKSLWSIKKVLR